MVRVKLKSRTILYMSDTNEYVRWFVTYLIDAWNAGIRKGLVLIHSSEENLKKVKQILKEKGIAVHLEHIESRMIDYENMIETDSKVKFSMAEVTEKTVKYPF